MRTGKATPRKRAVPRIPLNTLAISLGLTGLASLWSTMTSSLKLAEIMHILARQISTRVALVLYDRLVAATGGTPTADTVLSLDVDQLREIGTSRSKATHVRALAEVVSSGQLDSEQLAIHTDGEAEAALIRIRGIGPWSARMFLIDQLRRGDIPPAGDLGIRVSIRNVSFRPEMPTIDGTRKLSEAWMHYQTSAAALLWRSLAGPTARNAVVDKHPERRTMTATVEFLVTACLYAVFNERSEGLRAKAISEIFAEDAVLLDPEGVFTGHRAIGERARLLLEREPEFVFSAAGPARGSHDLGVLEWGFGPAGKAAVVSGMDIITVSGGQIITLHTLLTS